MVEVKEMALTIGVAIIAANNTTAAITKIFPFIFSSITSYYFYLSL
jgi:hypothetical protein